MPICLGWIWSRDSKAEERKGKPWERKYGIEKRKRRRKGESWDACQNELGEW